VRLAGQGNEGVESSPHLLTREGKMQHGLPLLGLALLYGAESAEQGFLFGYLFDLS